MALLLLVFNLIPRVFFFIALYITLTCWTHFSNLGVCLAFLKFILFLIPYADNLDTFFYLVHNGRIMYNISYIILIHVSFLIVVYNDETYAGLI